MDSALLEDFDLPTPFPDTTEASPPLLDFTMDSFLELRRPLHLGVVPQRIPLDRDSVIIGRGAKADVILYVGEYPSFVSREHAKLELDTDINRWVVSDLGSVNGMFHNSIKLTKDMPRTLSHGDRVYFGNPQHSFFIEYEFVSLPTSSSSTDSRRSHTNTSVEEVYDDIWANKVFRFLDIREIHMAGRTCKGWRTLAEKSMDTMDTIRWMHPWSVDSLLNIVQGRCSRSTLPVRSIITAGCNQITDDHVEQIARLCGQTLFHVDFSGTTTLTPRGMGFIAESCPHLKTLILRGCKRVGVGGHWEWMDVLAKSGNLEYCDFHCAGANDIVVTKLASLSPRLKRVDLGVACHEGITDVGLAALTDHCPLLEHVNLRGCKRIRDAGVVMLIHKCGKTLKSLLLHSCDDIGDEVLEAIGQSCTALEHVDLHRCMKVNDEGIGSLMAGTTRLTQMDLSNLLITDVALLHIARARPLLTVLDLRSCKLITGKGLLTLLQAVGGTLLRLDLNGCTRIKPADVFAIAKLCGNLQELEIGAKEDECTGWTKNEVAFIQMAFRATKTRVHVAFENEFIIV